MREQLLMIVLNDMHQEMPWFHGDISREEGNRRLLAEGHTDGLFM